MRSGGSSWEVRVKGNLTQRTDNGLINSSPISTITPIIRLQYGCSQTIVIPGKADQITQIVDQINHDNSAFHSIVADADGDIIRCRWAESLYGECAGVCRALPGATLSGVCVSQLCSRAKFKSNTNMQYFKVKRFKTDKGSGAVTYKLSSPKHRLLSTKARKFMVKMSWVD